MGVTNSQDPRRSLPSRQLARDRGPLVAQLHLQRDEDLLFLVRPAQLVQLAIKMVVVPGNRQADSLASSEYYTRSCSLITPAAHVLVAQLGEAKWTNNIGGWVDGLQVARDGVARQSEGRANLETRHTVGVL